MKKIFFGLAIFAAVSGVAHSQAFPEKSRPIRIVVPFGAGGGTDLIARAYAKAITEQSGAIAVVENKPGAEGIIGVETVKNASPDGYTILIGNTSTHVLNVHMLKSVPYDPVADFIPVSGVAKFALVLNAGPSTTFTSAHEAMEAARRNPGKYTYGSGTATTRLGMEMFEHVANLQLLSIPYKAMGQATNDLASGEIDYLINDVATSKPHYQAGRIRPLATTGSTRLAALPNVPTFREQGFEDYELTGWFAMFAPANTPADVVKILNAMLEKAAESKYVTDALATNSYEPLKMDSAKLTAMASADIDRWEELFRAMNKEQK